MRRHSPRHRTHRKLWVQTFSVFRPYFQLLLFGFWFVVPGSTGEITPWKKQKMPVVYVVDARDFLCKDE